MSLSLRQDHAKRAALAVLLEIEQLRKHPEELEALIREERVAAVLRYHKQFDRLTDKVITRFLDYVYATERRAR